MENQIRNTILSSPLLKDEFNNAFTKLFVDCRAIIPTGGAIGV